MSKKAINIIKRAVELWPFAVALVLALMLPADLTRVQAVGYPVLYFLAAMIVYV